MGSLRMEEFNQTEPNWFQTLHRSAGRRSPHLLHCVLRGEEGVTAPPAAGDRGEVGVAVIPQQVLREMLFHTEDQGAAVPLSRGQKGMRTNATDNHKHNILGL